MKYPCDIVDIILSQSWLTESAICTLNYSSILLVIIAPLSFSSLFSPMMLACPTVVTFVLLHMGTKIYLENTSLAAKSDATQTLKLLFIDLFPVPLI